MLRDLIRYLRIPIAIIVMGACLNVVRGSENTVPFAPMQTSVENIFWGCENPDGDTATCNLVATNGSVAPILGDMPALHKACESDSALDCAVDCHLMCLEHDGGSSNYYALSTLHLCTCTCNDNNAGLWWTCTP